MQKNNLCFEVISKRQRISERLRGIMYQKVATFNSCCSLANRDSIFILPKRLVILPVSRDGTVMDTLGKMLFRGIFMPDTLTHSVFMSRITS